MSPAAGVALAIAVVATHTGSCMYPVAVRVEEGDVRGELEDAGVIATVETDGDRLLVTFDDGRSLSIPGSRHYLIGRAPEPGHLLLVSTAPDGDALVGVISFNDEEQCFVAYSPAAVQGQGLLLGGGLLVPVDSAAMDEEVLEPGAGISPEPRPLESGADFYTHDGACLDQDGRVTRIVRGVYEGGLPEGPLVETP